MSVSYCLSSNLASHTYQYATVHYQMAACGKMFGGDPNRIIKFTAASVVVDRGHGKDRSAGALQLAAYEAA